MDQLIDLANTIRDAWYEGRSIIPLVGAGLSVDSGMPALQSIVRYVAKLQVYLDKKLYLPQNHADVMLPDLAGRFQKSPWEFLRAFGWPDRFQLNFDVRRGLQRLSSAVPERGMMTAEIGIALDKFAKQINPGGTWRLEDFAIAVDAHFGPKNSHGDADPKRLAKSSAGFEKWMSVDSFLYQVSADWKPLLREITGHKQELIDALFGRLARHRRPGLSHQFLAHLCNLLRIRTILTFNFDPLIETALNEEHLRNRVFAMEHGTQLPSLSLLDDAISVIKMHGGTHNILVDERVDYRVSPEYRRSFSNLVGDNPLLIVLGCSGNDRRLRELVQGVIEERGPRSKTAPPSVVWLHRAENNDIPQSLRECVKSFSTFDVGQTLRFLYTQITERLPTGRSPYPVHFTTPVLRRSVAEHDPRKPVRDKYRLTSYALSVFAPDLNDVSGRKVSSHQLMRAMARVPLGYAKIWVDLEEHHSLGQVAAEIISQIRRGDVGLNSFVSPVSPANAAMRVYRALGRSRYVLAIANIDAYVWRATTHHGVTSQFGKPEQKLLEDLGMFLDTLRNALAKEWQTGDSCLVLHFEYPRERHSESGEEKAKVRTLIGTKTAENAKNKRTLRGLLATVAERPKHVSTLYRMKKWPPEQQPWEEKLNELRADDQLIPKWNELIEVDLRKGDANLGDDRDRFKWKLFLTAICCYRRTREFTALAQLKRELDVGGDLHELLSVVASSSNEPGIDRPLSWTEGGGLWCDRVWRDTVYDYVTRYSGGPKLVQIRKKWPAKLVSKMIGQLTLISALHDIIARQYYLTTYLPSRDAIACLEYFYHRVSTMRYLAQLEALVGGKLGKDTSWGCKYDGGEILKMFARCYQGRPDKQTTFGSDWFSIFTSVSNNSNLLASDITRIRERCMRGLAEAWRRSEAELRRTLPSDQLIKWCETLLEYDLNRSVGKGPAKYNAGRLTRSYYQEKACGHQRGGETSTFTEALETFETAVYETLSKAYYERGDFVAMRACAEIRQERDQASENAAHCRLDMKIAEHWSGFLGNPATQPSGPGREIKSILDEKDPKGALIPECRLRLDYLRIERSLSVIAPVGSVPRARVFGVAEPTAEQSQAGLNDLAEAMRMAFSLAIKSIEFAREEHPMSEFKGMRSPILEATADHGLFLPYRSLFQIQAGRIKTAAGIISAQRVGKADSTFPFREQFTEAFRELANARSGIGPENSILLAIADISGAEAALAYVACLYRSHDSVDDPDGKDMLWQNDSKLRTAAGYLRQAEEHLAEAPQYVLVWRYYHALQVRYHLERTIWNMQQALTSFWSRNGRDTKYDDPERAVMEGGRLLDRARKGLAAIRNGLDYSSPKEVRFTDEWTYQWGRLGCAVFAGAMVRHAVAEKAPFSTFTEELAEKGNYRWLADILADCWEDLNISQGICPCRGSWKRHDSLKVSPGQEWGREWTKPILDGVSSTGQANNVETFRSLIASLNKGKMSAFSALRKWILDDGAALIMGVGGNDQVTIE